MPALATLPGLGKISAGLLRDVGIDDVATLRAFGAVGAFTALRMRFGKRITLNWVYALECAVLQLDWRMLPDERKHELRDAARAVIAELDTVR